MRIAAIGAGAIGGYCGAKLARAGHAVTFVDLGAHLAAIQERGLTIRSSTGDFTVRTPAVDRTEGIGTVDLVIIGLKTYDNQVGLQGLVHVVGPQTAVLTFQNGVDSSDEIAAVTGGQAVLAGAAYIATARSEPGVIEQTASHRRFVFGEVFEARPDVSQRVHRIGAAFNDADIQCEVVADGRVPIWEKFVYLSAFAGFTGASRLPIGALRSTAATRTQFVAALAEVESIARAEGVALLPGVIDRVMSYVDTIGAETRSSLLFDLSRGVRIEVEALLGAVVRRAAKHGISAPIMTTLYSVLKPHDVSN